MEALIKDTEVEELFLDCLFQDDEVIEGVTIYPPVTINGIAFKIGFNIYRLEKNRDKIISLLDNLMPEFRFETGFPFQNICIDKNQVLWTGLHQIGEQLLLLGLAIGEFVYLPQNKLHGLPFVKRIKNTTFTKDLIKYRVMFLHKNDDIDYIDFEAESAINFLILMNDELSKRLARWLYIEPIKSIEVY